jgi:hypothetical protein
MRRSIVAGFVFLAMSAAVRADSSCSQERLKQAAEKVKTAQNELLALGVGGGGMDTSVPAGTQNQIRAFKDALAAAADAFMNCERGGTSDAKGIESRLAELLGANRADSVRKPAGDSDAADRDLDQIYGANLKLTARSEDHDPPLISFKIGFGIACGRDEMLLMYQASQNGSENGWRRVIRWQSDPYKEISGAFGDFFEYVLVGPQHGDEWLVAAAHGKPWCTSNYSGFDLDVIKPGGSIAPQHTLFHKESRYRRDAAPTMRGEPDGFLLRLNITSLSPNSNERPGVYHYRLHQGQIHRYQPVADNVRDFLDEWLQADWIEAAEWTARNNLKSLGREHEIMEGLISSSESKAPDISYGPVQACSGKQKLVQVELDGAPAGFKYFQIEQSKDSFTMVSGSNSADAKCTGPDLTGDH